MPRNGRGGPRQGAPGKAYPNRNDLTGPPASAGALGGTANQVGAAPPTNGTPPGPGGSPTAAPGGGAGGLEALQQMMAQIPEGSRPGELTRLNAPSSRPGEPTTAGMDVGAGPGREALGAFAPGQPTQDMIALAKYLPVLESMQTRATSQKMRTLIRMLRASVPLEAREWLGGNIPPKPGEAK